MFQEVSTDKPHLQDLKRAKEVLRERLDLGSEIPETLALINEGLSLMDGICDAMLRPVGVLRKFGNKIAPGFRHDPAYLPEWCRERIFTLQTFVREMQKAVPTPKIAGTEQWFIPSEEQRNELRGILLVQRPFQSMLDGIDERLSAYDRVGNHLTTLNFRVCHVLNIESEIYEYLMEHMRKWPDTASHALVMRDLVTAVGHAIFEAQERHSEQYEVLLDTPGVSRETSEGAKRFMQKLEEGTQEKFGEWLNCDAKSVIRELGEIVERVDSILFSPIMSLDFNNDLEDAVVSRHRKALWGFRDVLKIGLSAVGKRFSHGEKWIEFQRQYAESISERAGWWRDYHGAVFNQEGTRIKICLDSLRLLGAHYFTDLHEDLLRARVELSIENPLRDVYKTLEDAYEPLAQATFDAVVRMYAVLGRPQ